MGSREFINGAERYILSLQKAPPNILRQPEVKERLKLVRDARLESKRLATQELAQTPAEFAFTTIPDSPFLMLPGVSSERRDYVPIGWLGPPSIPSNLVQVLVGASVTDFAILTSRMHMAWMRHIGGRLESRYRYSIGIVYNTFPWPDISDAAKATIETLAQAVLDARDG